MKKVSILFFLYAFLCTSNLFCSQPFTQDEYKYYVAARKLADLVFLAKDTINNNPEYNVNLNILSDRRASECSLDSTKYQTERGLFLEGDGYWPKRLYTPFGQYDICGKGICTPGVDRMPMPIDKMFEVELSKHVTMKESNQYGYHYAVTVVDGIQLLVPKLKDKKAYFMENCKEMDEKWDAMRLKYKEAQIIKKR